MGEGAGSWGWPQHWQCPHQPECPLIWWVGQGRCCQQGPLTVPHKTRVIQHPSSPVCTSRSQGQREEWKQHCDVGWETRHLQCRSEAHPRDGDRDSPGDKVWNPTPESRQKMCGWWLVTATKDWCPQGPDTGREVSALKTLQSNQKWKKWLALAETTRWSCKHLPNALLPVADEGSEGIQAAGRLHQPLFNITTTMKLFTQHSQEYRTRQVKGKATSWTWLGVPTPCLNNLRWWEVESRKLLVKP